MLKNKLIPRLTAIITGCSLVAFLLIFSACGTYNTDAKAEKITISILFGQSISDPGVEEMFADKILKEFPNVALDWESVDWDVSFYSAVNARIVAGDMPDIIIGKARDTAAFQPTGYLSPLETNIYEGVKQFALRSVSVFNVVYGVPLDLNYQGVIYNKEIFEKLGLEFPKTTAEMNTVIGVLARNGITPFAAHMRDDWYGANLLMQIASNEVFSRIPAWGDSFRAEDTSFSESKEFLRSFETVRLIVDNTWADAFSVELYECVKRFCSGDAAMFVADTRTLQSITELAADLRLGIFPYPNDSGNAKLLYEPNMTLMVNAKSENKLLAMDILSKIAKDNELIKQICEFTQSEPLIESITADSLTQLRADIERYTLDGTLADASVGSRQLRQTFLYALSKQMSGWLAGQAGLESVVQFADDNRETS